MDLLTSFDASLPGTGKITIDETKIEDACLGLLTHPDKGLVTDAVTKLRKLFAGGMAMDIATAAAKFDIHFDVPLPANFVADLRRRLLSNTPEEEA